MCMYIVYVHVHHILYTHTHMHSLCSHVQFHADYLKQSRSYLWEQSLEPLLEEDISRER